MKTIKDDHIELVKNLVKDPEIIMEQMTTEKCAIMHPTFGIAGECGELIEGIIENNIPLIVEESGDVLFYCIDFRYRTGYLDFKNNLSFRDRERHVNIHVLEKACSDLIDAVKKFVIYNDRSKLDRSIQYIFQIEASVCAHLERIGVSVDECRQANIKKLVKRYPKGYSDKSAKERLDKANEETERGSS